MPFSNLKRWTLLAVCIFLPYCCRGQSRFRSNQLKYVDKARHIAITNTLLPIATGIAASTFFKAKAIQTTASFLVVYGIVLGPSAGNLYAYDYLNGLLGAAARLAGGYLMKDATREIFGHSIADGVGWDKKKVSLGDTRILVGAGIVLGSAIYNIISAKASVHRYNRSIGYYIQAKPAYKRGHFVPMISANFSF